MNEIDQKIYRAIVVGSDDQGVEPNVFQYSGCNDGCRSRRFQCLMQVCTDRLKKSMEITVKLRRTSRDTVRLLQALMDLSGLKIINSRAIDLKNINAVVDGSPD